MTTPPYALSPNRRLNPAERMDHVVEALRTERDDIASLERRLRAARARRKVLVAKLRYAGWTLRQIEPHAGISNAAISQQERPSYPGDEPCQCGQVTLTGHHLTDRTVNGDCETVHYRISTGPDCEEMP
ncbi:MAG: hypothetical protein JWP11_2828 [Frankiales bacterium]|nr:hypothetical protein [Frankiales bacterium]